MYHFSYTCDCHSCCYYKKHPQLRPVQDGFDLATQEAVKALHNFRLVHAALMRTLYPAQRVVDNFVYNR